MLIQLYIFRGTFLHVMSPRDICLTACIVDAYYKRFVQCIHVTVITTNELASCFKSISVTFHQVMAAELQPILV